MSCVLGLKLLPCSICLTVPAAAPAFAHAELESAAPIEGEELGQAPAGVRIPFAEPAEAARKVGVEPSSSASSRPS